MIRNKIYYIALFLLFLSCQNQNCDLTSFDEMISKAKVIEYQHIKIFDNKFNSSIFYDTSNVTIFKFDEYNLGFQIQKNQYEWFYNSNELIELNHLNKTKSIDSLKSINDSQLWNKNLLSMLDTLSTKNCDSKLIDNTLYQHFSNKLTSTSKIDSNKILINELEYIYPKYGFDHFFHKELIIRDGDTLQIQTHFLKNINFHSTKSYEVIQNSITHNSYKILDNEEDLPFGRKPIREGDYLAKKVFFDIENQKTQIVNDGKEYTLVIFSFIGCTPCEIALRHLKEDEMGLKNEINLYYSSFQNNNSAVKKYLEDKNIFQNAFAIESNMIDEFRLPVSPTFVLIDSNGRIKKIIEGFDDTVLTTLNEMIKP